MAEEGGSGVDLGTLEVGIVGSLAPLEAALARAEQMLTNFDKKFGVATAKAGTQAGKAARASRTQPAAAAADVAPASAGAAGARNVNVKISTEGVRQSINDELGGEFKIKVVTDEIQIKVDQAFLRAQVIEAIRGVGVNLAADTRPAGGGHPGFAPPQQQQQQSRVFPPEVIRSLNQIGGLGDKIGDLHTVISESLQYAGQNPLPTRSEADSPLEKMSDIAERFGLTSSKLVDYLDEAGKPGTAIRGGPLGPGSPHLAGLDPNDIAQIGQQARIVSELSKGSAFLTQFFEALPHTVSETITHAQAAAVPHFEAPAPGPAEQPTRERRTLLDPTSPEAAAARGKILTREDFIDYVRGTTGPLTGALPNVRDIAIPAKRAGPGDIPLESLQATKTSAGRTQGIQGGLGPLTEILRFAERGGFENFAEFQQNGRPTGRFTNYDPESVEGGRVRSHGFGYFGEEAVRRANPIQMLEMTLRNIFPGIEKRTDPTNAMTSVLERVLAGPGRQAIEAGKRLSIPSGGTATDEPSHTSRAPAGGPLGRGSATSLRRGLIDEAEATRGIPQERIIEALRTAAAAQSETGAQNRRRVNAGVRGQDVERMIEADYTRRELYPKAPPGQYLGVLSQLSKITGYDQKGLPESMRSVMLSPQASAEDAATYGRSQRTGEIQKPVFSGSAIRRLLDEVDARIFDALGLEGRKRKVTALPDYIQAERSAVRNAIYAPQAQAEADVMRQGEGSGGRRPRRVVGQRVTGYQTNQGTVETVPEYARPATSLDTETQSLMARRNRQAQERTAALAAADAEALRRTAARFGGRERRTPDPKDQGLDLYTFSDEATRKQASAFYGRSAAALSRRVPGVGPEVDDRLAEIRGIQKAADTFMGTIKNLPAGAAQQEAAGRAALPDAVRAEVMEILQTRTAGTARQPGMVAAREPLTGDKFRARVSRAGGRTFEEFPSTAGAGAGGTGGVGVGGPGGRSFVPGGAPIEVIVIGKFPLPVEVVGSSGEGGGRGGRPRKNLVTDEKTQEAKQPTISAEQAAMRIARGAATRADTAARRLYGPSYVPAESRESRQKTYEQLFAQRDTEDKRMRTIQPVNRSQIALERQREREERIAASRGTNYLRLSRAQDEEQESLAPFQARIQRAERRIPRRGFGASLTDLVTASLGGGGFTGQLADIDRARGELSELRRLTGLRAGFRAERGLRVEQQERAAPGSPAERRANQRIGEIDEALGGLAPAIKDSQEKLVKFSDSAGSGARTLRSFAAAGVGGAVGAGIGSITFGLGLAITGPLIQGVAQGIEAVVGPQLERLGGFAGTAERITGAAAEQVATGGGIPSSRVTAQREATIGLASATADRFAGVLNQRTDTEAGNKQLQMQLDELNSFIKIRGENEGRLGDLNLTRATGGFFGLGGTAPTSELISTQFDLLPTRQERTQITDQLQAAADLMANQPAGSRGAIQNGQVAQQALQRLVDAGATIDFFNDALKAGGETTLKFSADLEQIPQKQLDAQAAALRSQGAFGLARQVTQGRAAIEENGQVVTDPARLIDAIRAIASPKADPQQLLKANSDSLKAALEGRGTRLGLQVGTLIPAEQGIQNALNPLPPASAGINTTGLSPAAARSVNRELAQTQRLYDSITADAQKQRDLAVDFVTNGADLFGTGQKVGGLGATAGADFASSLDKAAGYAKEIQQVQVDNITKQAAYEAHQYAYQIDLAKRSLRDAKGLTGQITNDTKNLGVIERQQFTLSRESQQLGLELSQRQINFQRAIAGFQAPGLSSEEREARKNEAKIEADFAQKQLDIQKKLFALGGQQFKISAGRGVQDITRQLGLLTEGREVQVSTAAAEKKIVALTKKQEIENKKVAAYYQTAVENTNDIISLTQELAAATGKDMSKLANDVIQAYAKVYRGLIDTIESSLPSSYGNTGSTHETNRRAGHASGLIGTTMGATDLGIAGEAGAETVAILRNPRPFSSGDLGGGGRPIQIVIQGNTVRSDSDIDEIARKVENVLNSRAAQLGIRPPGG